MLGIFVVVILSCIKVNIKGILSEIESFLTKCPRNKKFRNDMKTVFEMSQKDSRLTPKEKQEIVNEFTSKYKFILSEGQAK